MTRGVRFEREETTEPKRDARDEQRQRFQERIARGRYDELYEHPVRNLLREGAAIRGVDEELGAIRFALAKLLAEELDASKLAAGVARLTSATVQAMRLDQSMSGGADESFGELLDQFLTELEEEQRNEPRRAGRQGRGVEGDLHERGAGRGPTLGLSE